MSGWCCSGIPRTMIACLHKTAFRTERRGRQGQYIRTCPARTHDSGTDPPALLPHLDPLFADLVEAVIGPGLWRTTSAEDADEVVLAHDVALVARGAALPVGRGAGVAPGPTWRTVNYKVQANRAKREVTRAGAFLARLAGRAASSRSVIWTQRSEYGGGEITGCSPGVHRSTRIFSALQAYASGPPSWKRVTAQFRARWGRGGARRSVSAGLHVRQHGGGVPQLRPGVHPVEGVQVRRHLVVDAAHGRYRRPPTDLAVEGRTVFIGLLVRRFAGRTAG